MAGKPYTFPSRGSMNKDILTMIELQKHMDKIILCRTHVKDEQEKLLQLTNECTLCERGIVIAEDKLKSIKGSIKANELELNGADERKIKLEARKLTLTSEREVEAVTREINAVVALISTCEESLIGLMDENDVCEKEISRLKQNYADKQDEYARVKAESDKKIIEWSESEVSHNSQYELLIKNLDSRVKPKFSKLISGKPFKAIAAVTNNSCGACNFTIPSSLVHESMKNDALSICTNCGRFIYSIPVQETE